MPGVNKILVPAMVDCLQSHADQRVLTNLDYFLQRSDNLDSLSSQSNSSSAVPWNSYGERNRTGNCSPSGDENLNNEGALLDLLRL
ncbi:hypothetical protein SUGI_0017640 [Cryptomeria japonica]|nr:hypothetical protein SUGI_0017640 [Cryptomeria japonica]